MAECGVDHGSDSALRDLVLVVESEPDVDPDVLDRSVRQLHAELKDLDVESIAPLTSEKAPPDAKGIDPSSLGALLITLPATGGVFTVLIETARDWLARHSAARSISVTIDGTRSCWRRAPRRSELH
jgi:hypothetical protein